MSGILYRQGGIWWMLAVLLAVLICSPAYADHNGLDSRSGLDLPIGAGGTTHLTLHADSDLMTVKGLLQLGSSSSPCNASTTGSLRYNGGAVQVCNGSSWAGLGSITCATFIGGGWAGCGGRYTLTGGGCDTGGSNGLSSSIGFQSYPSGNGWICRMYVNKGWTDGTAYAVCCR